MHRRKPGLLSRGGELREMVGLALGIQGAQAGAVDVIGRFVGIEQSHGRAAGLFVVRVREQVRAHQVAAGQADIDVEHVGDHAHPGRGCLSRRGWGRNVRGRSRGGVCVEGSAGSSGSDASAGAAEPVSGCAATGVVAAGAAGAARPP